MHKAIRSQADDLGDVYSGIAGTGTVGWEDTARQEFKAEADINEMLSRFNVIPPLRPTQFGETDYTIDLQAALAAIQQAKRAHGRLPAAVKADYPTWQSLLNGIAAGELDLKEGEEPPPPPPPPVEEGG